MVQAVVVAKSIVESNVLAETLGDYCPQVELVGVANCVLKAKKLMSELIPDLLFLSCDFTTQPFVIDLLEKQHEEEFETILITKFDKLNAKFMQYGFSGFVFKPISPEELRIAVGNAEKRINLKKEKKRFEKFTNQILNQLPGDHLIGVPTIEGFIFLGANSIIRCEGMQRCTRIVTQEKSNIISSYNLGEFKRLLKDFGFFAIHRSHLINLRHVKKYTRDGSITMVDDSVVPVSQKNKKAFLDCMIHL